MVASTDPDNILRAAARGSYDAFEQLVRIFDQRLKAACKRVCWPPVDYEDVAQIVWTEAYAKIASFDNSDGLRKWLVSTARLRAIDESRRLKNLTGGSEAVNDVGDRRSKDGLETMINRERTQALQDCMQSENSAVRAFVLKHIDGLSYDEISSLLSIPSGTIASRISRGGAAIARCMEGKLS